MMKETLLPFVMAAYAQLSITTSPESRNPLILTSNCPTRSLIKPSNLCTLCLLKNTPKALRLSLCKSCSHVPNVE
jgi:hypothetical protein